jgi:hypothetical protein
MHAWRRQEVLEQGDAGAGYRVVGHGAGDHCDGGISGVDLLRP